MFQAVFNNKPNFVKLFLENGVDLREFLDITTLVKFYNKIPDKEVLRELLERQIKFNSKEKQAKDGTYFSLSDVADLIANLMGDFYHPLYRFASTQGVSKQPTGNELENMNPARELFIWCILMNRLDMAVIFWDEGQETGIAASLIGQILLRGLKDRSSDLERKRELDASILHLKHRSVGLLRECYLEDEHKCYSMLVRELPLYGNSTIIELSVHADNKMFIAHDACQSLFNRIWSGKMTEDNGEHKLWISIIMPFCVPWFIKFRGTEKLFKEKPKALSADKTKNLKQQETIQLERKDTVHVMLCGFQPIFFFKENHNKSQSNMMTKIVNFYTSPKITFRCTQLSLLFFLGLFSLVILTDFHAPYHYASIITIKEWVLIFWVFTLLCEEIRQIAITEAPTLHRKLTTYIKDKWNSLDVLTIGLFIVGEILRFINNDHCLEVARIILALTLMTFCFRMLHMFAVHKNLGPKLVMIGKMVIETIFFVGILLVFVVAYGLCIQAILYPNAALDGYLLKEVIQRPYFQMYGHLFLEEIEGEVACTDDPNLYGNNTLPRCPTATGTWLVPIMLGIYILITNVLMLNLLIAMFSYTVNAIQDNTDRHWAFQRYYLITEFHKRPPLAPPLIFISHIYMLIRMCCQTCKKCQDIENPFRKSLLGSDKNQIIQWERMNLDKYRRKTEAENQEKTESQAKVTNTRVENIAKQVDEIMENSFLMQTADNVKLPPALENRMDHLEQKLDRIINALGKNPKPELKSVEEIRKEEEYSEFPPSRTPLHVSAACESTDVSTNYL